MCSLSACVCASVFLSWWRRSSTWCTANAGIPHSGLDTRFPHTWPVGHENRTSHQVTAAPHASPYSENTEPAAKLPEAGASDRLVAALDGVYKPPHVPTWDVAALFDQHTYQVPV